MSITPVILFFKAPTIFLFTSYLTLVGSVLSVKLAVKKYNLVLMEKRNYIPNNLIISIEILYKVVSMERYTSEDRVFA